MMTDQEAVVYVDLVRSAQATANQRQRSQSIVIVKGSDGASRLEIRDTMAAKASRGNIIETINPVF